MTTACFTGNKCCSVSPHAIGASSKPIEEKEEVNDFWELKKFNDEIIVFFTWPCQHHILFSFQADFQLVIIQSILVRIVWNLKCDHVCMLAQCSQQ